MHWWRFALSESFVIFTVFGLTQSESATVFLLQFHCRADVLMLISGLLRGPQYLVP